MSQSYHVRPSELLGVRGNTPSAFFIDRAVWYFATSLTDDMDAAEKALGDNPTAVAVTKARSDVYDAYMSIEQSETTTPPKGRYADPMAAIRSRG